MAFFEDADLNPSEVINAQNPGGEDPSKRYVQAGDTGGYLVGTGVTVGEGRSITPQQATAQTEAALASGIPQEFVSSFLAENPLDTNRIAEAYRNAQQHGGGETQTMASFGSGAPTTTAPYNPWTRAFSPTLGAFPSDIMQPWSQTYTPLDPNTIRDNPLVKTRIDLGREAIEKGAAARGTLLTPGTQSYISTMAGDVASDEYWNLRNAASQDYTNAYNIFAGENNRRSDTYGSQWLRDFGKEQFDYGAFKENQTIPFGMGVQNRQLGQADRGLDLQSRGLDLGFANFGETQRMNDFGQYKWADDAYWDRLFRAGTLGTP